MRRDIYLYVCVSGGRSAVSADENGDLARWRAAEFTRGSVCRGFNLPANHLNIGRWFITLFGLSSVCKCISEGGGWGWGLWWRWGAHFGCMHNEIPRVIPPVCQGPRVQKTSRGWRRGWVGCEERGRVHTVPRCPPTPPSPYTPPPSLLFFSKLKKIIKYKNTTLQKDKKNII